MELIRSVDFDKAAKIVDYDGFDTGKCLNALSEAGKVLAEYMKHSERDDSNPMYFDLREKMADAMIALAQAVYVTGMDDDVPVTEMLGRQM